MASEEGTACANLPWLVPDRCTLILRNSGCLALARVKMTPTEEGQRSPGLARTDWLLTQIGTLQAAAQERALLMHGVLKVDCSELRVTCGLLKRELAVVAPSRPLKSGYLKARSSQRCMVRMERSSGFG